MGCLGVHFALSDEDVTTLRSFEDEQDRITYIQEVLEDNYFSDHEDLLAQSDKAWDAMHRVLSDGEMTWEGGRYPLNHVVLGGELLYTESDYIVSLKTPQQVKDIAAALPTVTETEFRKLYFAIDPDSYGMELTDEDFGYTWDWFQPVRELYLRASKEGRYVLFTADQ